MGKQCEMLYCNHIERVHPPEVMSPQQRHRLLDRIGATGSLLCALHCALLPLVIVALPSLGLASVLGDRVEEAFVLFASLVGGYSVLAGYRRHRLWQALALMPGGSRSGTTITGGLFAGLDRAAAARFSFLLSLPAILAAGVKDFWDERESLVASADDAAALAVGLVVSAAVGYLAIAWLLHFLKRYSTAVFIVYRVALGGVILAALALGYLS